MGFRIGSATRIVFSGQLTDVAINVLAEQLRKMLGMSVHISVDAYPYRQPVAPESGGEPSEALTVPVGGPITLGGIPLSFGSPKWREYRSFKAETDARLAGARAVTDECDVPEKPKPTSSEAEGMYNGGCALRFSKLNSAHLAELAPEPDVFSWEVYRQMDPSVRAEYVLRFPAPPI